MCVCRCKEDKRVPVLTLPRLLCQDTEVRLTSEPLAGPDLAAWQPIERVVKDAVTGQDRCGYYLQPIGSTTGCTITEKAPTRAFSWLKAPTSAFTFNSLLPRIDFSYLGCHKTYYWVGRG